MGAGRPPGTGNPNSKYAKQKEKQAQQLVEERERMRLEIQRELSEKQAEKERELSEKQAEKERELSELKQKIAESEAEKQRLISEKEAEKEAQTKATSNTVDNENIIEKEIEKSGDDSDNDEKGAQIGDDDDDDELLKQMREATQPKSADEKPPIEEPAADDDRFSEATESKTEIPKVEMKDSADGENVDAGMNADDSAMVIINGINTLNKIVLPKMYEAEFFTDEERRAMRRIIKRSKIQKNFATVLEDEDLDKITAFEDYEDYCESVPFTDDEINNLRVPLRKLMVGKGMTISPTWAFIIALLLVLVPRYYTVVAKKWQNSRTRKEESKKSQWEEERKEKEQTTKQAEPEEQEPEEVETIEEDN